MDGTIRDGMRGNDASYSTEPTIRLQQDVVPRSISLHDVSQGRK
jgi:hypothetical protein